MNGDRVKAVQELLLDLSYSLGGYDATGNFRENTYNAVGKFQKDTGLAQNGVVANRTLAVLFAAHSHMNLSDNRYGVYTKAIELAKHEKDGDIPGNIVLMSKGEYGKVLKRVRDLKKKSPNSIVKTVVKNNRLVILGAVKDKVKGNSVPNGTGNSGVMDAYNYQTQGTRKTVSLDDAYNISRNIALNQNIAQDKSPVLFPQIIYNATKSPSKDQTLDVMKNLFGSEYSDAWKQQDINTNLQIANVLLLIGTAGSDYMAAVQYNNNLQAEINAASANISKVIPKTDFYVTPSGSAIPATGYRYMDSKYASQTISSQSAPGSYIGFTKFDSASAVQNAYQISPMWSDCKLRGEFNTLQVIDNIYVPKTYGNTGAVLEPITVCYPQYGTGGYYQLKVDSTIKFNNVTMIGD